MNWLVPCLVYLSTAGWLLFLALFIAPLTGCGSEYGTSAQIAIETPTPVVQPAELGLVPVPLPTPFGFIGVGRREGQNSYYSWGGSTEIVCRNLMQWHCAPLSEEVQPTPSRPFVDGSQVVRPTPCGG